MLRADLHLHTYHSGDCGMSPHVILKAAGARGVNCLAITDHNSIKGSLELQRIAPIRIILAEEIKTLQGEIIGLFLQEEIPRRLSAEETVSKIKEQGGLVYVPHPFDRLRGSRLRRQTLLEIVGQVDIMEVFNSRVTFPRDNALAREFADRFGLAHGGGSDAHVAYEIGRTVVEIPDFETPAEFLIALRQGAVRGRLSPPLVHLASTFRKFRRRYLPRR